MRRQVSVPRGQASPSHAVCSGPCVGPAQGEPQVPKPRSVRGRPPPTRGCSSAHVLTFLRWPSLCHWTPLHTEKAGGFVTSPSVVTKS